MEKRLSYLTWEEFFLGVAKLAALRSKDPNTQVGACIVSKDNRILSTGYNGAPNKFSDEKFPWNRDPQKGETKYKYVCHAELNAILNFRGSMRELQDAAIYVEYFPCNECAKAIVQSGISRVVYEKDYDTSGHTEEVLASERIFKECGIEVQQTNPKGTIITFSV